MTQSELSSLLHSTGCPVNEGVSSLKNEKVYPRIDYWEYAWEDVMASGEDFTEKTTWQVSFYARKPREAALLQLRDKLRELGFHPQIFHEYVPEDHVWHSYFSLETTDE